MIEGTPLPATDDPADAPFWQSALRAELCVQQCAGCARHRFPPRPMCPHCNATEHRWSRMSGRGRIWSFAAPQPPLLPGFTALLPYVTAIVELDEDTQLRMVGALVDPRTQSIRGIDPASVRIGAPVRVVFVRHADDVALPCWSLSNEEIAS